MQSTVECIHLHKSGGTEQRLGHPGNRDKEFRAPSFANLNSQQVTGFNGQDISQRPGEDDTSSPGG